MSTTYEKTILVFGSNTEGKHGKGAARAAFMAFGARPNQSMGLQGNSYAIVTKDLKLGERSIPLEKIQEQIHVLVNLARKTPNWEFIVTRIGCGLSGYKDEEIGPMFRGSPLNMNLPGIWEQYR